MAPQPSRGLTPAQQRERRSKMLAGGLGVVLVVVCVVQVPKLMKGHHATTAQTAAPVAPAASAATTPGSTPAAASFTAPVGVAPPGQLTSFTKFVFKDPFVAQVGSTTTATSTTASGTAKKPAAGTTTTTQSQPATQHAQQPAQQPAKKKATPKKKTVKVKPKPVPPNAAVIETDGKNQLVTVGVSFPKAAPLFKLVALNPKLKVIHIGVIDGSFTSGGPTLPVHPGQKITLANETDGSTYSVKLVKLIAATPAQLAAATGTSSSSGSSSTSSPSGTSPGTSQTNGSSGSGSTPGSTTTTTATQTTSPTTTSGTSTTTPTTTTTTTQGSTTTTQEPPLQGALGATFPGK